MIDERGEIEKRLSEGLCPWCMQELEQTSEPNTRRCKQCRGTVSKSGVPDIIGCYEGKFFGIECKAGKNKPTPLQEKNLSDIKNSGGISLVINEDNIDDVLIYVGGQNRDPRQLELDFEGSPV